MNLVKYTIITLLLLISFGFSAQAQGTALQPFEGATHTYMWDGLQEGVEYEFYVTADAGGNSVFDDGVTKEFDFLTTANGTVNGGNSAASAQVHWNPGAALTSYFLWIKITGTSGCSNYRFVEILPQPNNRSIGFDVVASNECFSPGGNEFELPVSFLGNDGELLAQNQFPINVDFTVNGTAYQQNMQSADENLQIESAMFAADPAQDTQVLVEITGATDAHSAQLFPGEENSTHTRTIFAIPVIEFTQQLKLQKKLNEETTAHIMYSPVGFDWQEPGTDYTGGE